MYNYHAQRFCFKMFSIKEAKIFTDINHMNILNFSLSAALVGVIFNLVGLSLGAQIIIARNRDFEHVLSCIQKYKVRVNFCKKLLIIA